MRRRQSGNRPPGLPSMIPTSKRAESMARHPSARPVLFDGETAQPDLGWHDSYEHDRWLLTSREPWPDVSERRHESDPEMIARALRAIGHDRRQPDDDSEPLTALDVTEYDLNDLERVVHVMLPNRRSQIVSKPLESGASVQGAGDRVATLINRGAPWLASMLADTQDALDAMTADRDRLYDQSLDHE